MFVELNKKLTEFNRIAFISQHLLCYILNPTTNIFLGESDLNAIEHKAFLLKIEGIPQGTERYKKSHYVARKFSEKIQCPVDVVYDKENDYLVSFENIDNELIIENFTIKPVKQVNMKDYPRQLEKFLYQEAQKQLWKKDLWNNNYNSFFSYKPALKDDKFIVYRGVWFRFDIIDNKILLTIDPISRMTYSATLADYIKTETDDLAKKIGCYFVLDHGIKKSICRLTKIDTNNTISSPTFPDNGKTISVIDFIREHRAEQLSRIDESEPTIQIQYGDKDSRIYHTAPSLLQEVLATKDVSKIASKQYFLSPNERWKLAKEFFSYLKKLRLSTLTINFSKDNTLFNNKICQFQPPTFIFGINQKISPKVNELKKFKEINLKEFGPEAVVPIYKKIPIIIPKQVPDYFAYTLYNDFKAQIKKYFRVNFPEKTTIWKYDSNPLDIVDNLQNFKNDIAGLIVLLHTDDENSYFDFKGMFENIPSQMITFRLANLRHTLPKHKMGLYWSKIFIASVGLMAKLGCRPWILDESLNFDFNIGIDVGGRTGKAVCYSYLFDKSGRSLGIGKHASQKKESIEQSDMENAILSILKRSKSDNINSIAIYRDGFLAKSELEGIRNACSKLKSENIMNDDSIVIGINVKKSVPYRFFQKDGERMFDGNIGNYLILDHNHGIISTTGYPLIHQGMGRPLLIEKIPIIGDMSMEKILQDTYFLSHLNWGSVSLGMKLPATIKYAEDQIELSVRGVFSNVLPL